MKELFKLIVFVAIVAVIFYSILGGAVVLYSMFTSLLAKIIGNIYVTLIIALSPFIIWTIIEKIKKKKDSDIYKGKL